MAHPSIMLGFFHKGRESVAQETIRLSGANGRLDREDESFGNGRDESVSDYYRLTVRIHIVLTR
jgi:hypothetical protein